MHLVVTSNLSREIVVLDSPPALNLVYCVAEAFSRSRSDEVDLHVLLKNAIGDFRYMWYCIDMSDRIYKITYSDEDIPRILTFQGQAAVIAAADAAPLEVYIQEADLMKPTLPRETSLHPCNVDNIEEQGSQGQ